MSHLGQSDKKSFMKRDILRNRGWLSLQPRAIQDAVLANGREQVFEPGTSVFSVGDPPGGCFALLQGQLAVSIAPNMRGPNLVHVARPGTWYGEGAYLTRGLRRVGLHPVVESTLFHLPLDAMDRLSAKDAEWTRRFAQMLMINLDLALHALDDLLIEDPSRRVAAVLVRCLGEEESGTLSISQAELGHLSNTSRKVVNRVLGSFVERGWLRQGYSKIEVTEVRALRDHAESTKT